MNRIRTSALIACVGLAASTIAAPFTPGNVVVVRVGDGSAAPTNAATPVFLDEYTPAGTLVQTIPLPTAVSGNNRRLTLSGTATSEGTLTLSRDGRYLLLAGYDADPGTTGIAATTVATVNRVIARIDCNGVIDTSTALTDAYNANNIRSVTSIDGSAYWTGGTGSGTAANATGGVRYVLHGGTTSTLISETVTNVRVVNIDGGSANLTLPTPQLYTSSASGAFVGVSSVATGTPSTSGQIITRLPGFPGTGTSPSPYDYLFVPAIAGPSAAELLLVADDRTLATGGGLQVWTGPAAIPFPGFSLATVQDGLTAGLRHLALARSGAQNTLFATSADATSAAAGNKIHAATFDSGSSTFTFSLVATAPGNTAFRGIDLVPTCATTPSCYANCDGSTNAPVLNALDFSCFLTRYVAGEAYANCDGSTNAPVLNALDFSCFLTRYVAGCR